ncbi:MAG: tripartite tricarboxylate transporter permease [Thermodesulfobacteriota bacterium]
MFEAALPALMDIFNWPGPFYLCLGVLLGLVFGILPGLGGPQVLALLFPMTYGMDINLAMVLIIGAMASVPFGGSISAILINTPGTGQNAATCFDGFPLSQQGKAGMAIAASATASCLGGIFGAVVLTLLLPVGRRVVLLFSYPEYFMLAIMGLSVIAVFSGGASLWKGLASAVFGLMLASIGYDPVTGSVRFTFGSDYLWDGIRLVPSFIGLFAVGEAIELFLKRGKIAETAYEAKMAGIGEGIKSIFRHFGLFIRCSVIGCIIGIIPGVGGAVANFLAYGHAVQSSKNPETYGTGDIRGVIAPEASNNAKDGGALVPTLIFGIPGSLEMAVLLGILIVLGIEPGPRMMMDHPETVMVLIYVLVVGNIVASTAGLFGARYLLKLTYVPTTLLSPAVFMLGLVGAYVTEGSIDDVILALVFGVLAFFMKRYGFSRVAVVIALVLGELAEKTFHQTLMLKGVKGFFISPISTGLFIATVAMVLFPYLRASKRKKQADLSKAVQVDYQGKGKAVKSIGLRLVLNEAIVFNLLMIAFFLTLAILAQDYNPRARAIPTMLGFIGAAMLILQVLADAVPGAGAKLGFIYKGGVFEAAPPSKGDEKQEQKTERLLEKTRRAGDLLQVGRLVLWLAGFVGLIAVTHYLVAVGAFVLSLTRLEAKETWKRSLLMTLSVVSGFFILFHLLLQIQV